VAVLLLLRATGSHAGWAFSCSRRCSWPCWRSFLFLFALSLAGQFDIGLSLTSVGGGLAQKQGYAGSFFTGVLATVVARPARHPLWRGGRVALAQSGRSRLAVFTALALGWPLPTCCSAGNRPGRDCCRVPARGGGLQAHHRRHLLCDGHLAGVVYGQIKAAGGAQIRRESDSAADGVLLMMAIAGWVLGRWPAKWGSGIAAVLLIALGLAIPLSQARGAQRAGAETATAGAAGAFATNGATNTNGPRWRGSLTRAGAGRSACSGPPGLHRLHRRVVPPVPVQRARGVEVCRRGERAAEGRRGDDESRLDQRRSCDHAEAGLGGRAGVPTYVIYPAAASAAADVLPEFLTKDLC